MIQETKKIITIGVESNDWLLNQISKVWLNQLFEN